jgi:hypothetical protein
VTALGRAGSTWNAHHNPTPFHVKRTAVKRTGVKRIGREDP